MNAGNANAQQVKARSLCGQRPAQSHLHANKCLQPSQYPSISAATTDVLVDGDVARQKSSGPPGTSGSSADIHVDVVVVGTKPESVAAHHPEPSIKLPDLNVEALPNTTSKPVSQLSACPKDLDDK